MRIKQIKQRILEHFKDAKSELNFNNNYQLLVAVMLSAQCLDKRVNMITPSLFEIYPDIFSLANAKLFSVQELIKSCNFYQNKSINLIKMAQKVRDDFGGEIPMNFKDLTSLAGVGEKTANVVLAEALNANVMAVDTHIFRVAKRLDLSYAKTPNECAKELSEIFVSELARLHKAMVLFGRYTCTARKPKCDICFLKDLCKNANS